MNTTSTENTNGTTAGGSPQDELRAHLRGMWASVSGGWAEYADLVDARSAHLTERMLDAAHVGPGRRVVELACGPGGVGLAAARRVGLGGEVVVSDVAAEMAEIAAARARAAGLEQVTACVRDLEAIDDPDDSYDAVLCREGLMFAPEPDRAAREIHRVLRPGGYFAVAVWGPRASNPWLGIVLDSVGAELGVTVPPPGVPGPFALEDRDRVESLFAAAGFADIAVGEEAMQMGAPSFDEWWTRTCALAGPLSRMLEALDSEKLGAIRERARTAVAEREGSDATGALELPGVTLVASGRV